MLSSCGPLYCPSHYLYSINCLCCRDFVESHASNQISQTHLAHTSLHSINDTCHTAVCHVVPRYGHHR